MSKNHSRPPAATRRFRCTPADAEAELALARQRDLYAVVDPVLDVVEIKIRGRVFVTLPMAGWGLFTYRRCGRESPLSGGPSVAAPAGTAAELALPAVWIVAGEAASAGHRRVATIEALRPLDAAEPVAAPAPPSAAVRPSEFEMQLASGWVLKVAPELTAAHGVAVWAARLADGWASLRSQTPARPPLLALALDADAARRLHHVLRPGTAILVRSPAAAD